MDIIVVDEDLASINNLMAQVLDKIDIKITLFNKEPIKSLMALDEDDYDLVILDVDLTKASFLDLAFQMKEKKKEIKFILTSKNKVDEIELYKKLNDNLLGICYKPFNNFREYLNLIKSQKQKKSIYFKTFPTFDMFINDRAVLFPCAKSKELLALLVDRRGSTLNIGEAVAYLWLDKDQDLAKRLYREAVCRLRDILRANNLEKLIKFGRGQLVLYCEYASCDLWDYLDNKKNNYYGEYLDNYDWSIERQNELDRIEHSRK